MKITALFLKTAAGSISQERKARELNISRKWMKTEMKIFFQMPIPKPVDIKEYLRCGSGSRSFIPIFAVLLSTGSINAKALLNPKLLYYTPGLWELTGAAFWRAFFFETPFVLFRGFFWALIPMMIVLYLIFAFKANMQYQKMQDDKQGK